MKKTSITLTVASIFLAICAFTIPFQTASFTGVIIYGININSDANPQVAQMMQGSTMKCYIKGDKSRIESSFSGMYKQIVITDKANNPGEPVILIDMMGNKYQLKMDDKTKKMADASKPDIKIVEGSSKTIAGYVCKEAQAVVTDKKTGNKYTSDIYYTDKLPYINGMENGKFQGLGGMPLSFTSNRNGTSFTMAAQSVTKGAVADSLFVIPSGYKLMTEDEMQKDLVQKMGGGNQ